MYISLLKKSKKFGLSKAFFKKITDIVFRELLQKNPLNQSSTPNRDWNNKKSNSHGFKDNSRKKILTVLRKQRKLSEQKSVKTLTILCKKNNQKSLFQLHHQPINLISSPTFCQNGTTTMISYWKELQNQLEELNIWELHYSRWRQISLVNSEQVLLPPKSPVSACWYTNINWLSS